MPLPLLTILAMCCFVLCGYIAGRNEATMVYERISMGDRRDLDHSSLLLVRVVVIGAIIAGAVLLFPRSHTAAQCGTVVALALVAFGAFVPVHRFTFNHERANHPLYLSPGNNYDTRYLRRYVRPWPMYLRERYAQYYGTNATIRAQVHAAGTMAYTVELAVLLTGIVLTAIIHLATP